MKHKTIYFFVQSLDKKGDINTVCHSKDEETDELYYRFFDRKKAVALMEAERKATPESTYRIVKITETFEAENFH